MIRKMSFCLLLACLTAGSIASAREIPTPVRVTDPQIRSLGESMTGTGTVGNTNAAAWIIPDWFWGNEGYKILFNPAEQLACPLGFVLEAVHMVVDFDETMVPVTFDAWVDLESAVWDGACHVPGPEECVSQPRTVTIEAPGMYDLAFPIDCECAYIRNPVGAPYLYMLSVHFEGFFDMNLVADDLPTPCTVYNQWEGSGGWYDLYESFSGAGNLLIYGDVVCCDDPVSAADLTWSQIKSLYE